MASLAEIQQAQERIQGQVVLTPCARSETLSAQLGFELFIKFENQQFTASFKERGALNHLLVTRAEGRSGGAASRGVIAMSAGNHAQALAYHGARLGIATTIVMPRSTPNAKVTATRGVGAEVILHGDHFDETLAHTRMLAAQQGLDLVHPFDDASVIAGQGTIGLELLAQTAGLDAVIVPVGGGDPIPLMKKRLRVGRRDGCDIVLNYGNVSGHHCLLEVEEGYWFIENHCPICAAARRCQNFCRSELQLFQSLFAEQASVTREDYILDGARRCSYRITPL